MIEKFIHPSTGLKVTRDAYRAITTEALIAECHALEASYASGPDAHVPKADADVFEGLMLTITEALAQRVDEGDPVAVNWYNEYDDDADLDAEALLWSDQPQLGHYGRNVPRLWSDGSEAFESTTGISALLAALRSEDDPQTSEPIDRQETNSSHDAEVVRLTVYRMGRVDPTFGLNSLATMKPSAIVRQVELPASQLADAAAAVVREHVPVAQIEQLIDALGVAFASTPPNRIATFASGATRLLFVAVWPGAQGAGRLAPSAIW